MVSSNLVSAAAEQARELIAAAVAKAAGAGLLPEAPLPAFVVEIPADTSHGDFASNIAMAGAKAFRAAPQKIAAVILENLSFEGSWFLRAEVAGPGFLNLFLKKEWFAAVISSIGEMGGDYGRTSYGEGRRVVVEYVSANPTGPMHMGNARGGIIGDVLSAAMDACGYEVTREFYVNDAGNQIEKFALSLNARYMQIYKGEEGFPFPEDGYFGDDIRERAQEFADLHGDKYLEAEEAERKQALVDYALPRNIEAIRATLEQYRITYNVWFRESRLHESGAVTAVVEEMRRRGHAYEQEGAIWYRATDFGAEKDEVLVRQNGHPTYFAADIAYHHNKFATRGFEKGIDVWGADHHGHVARLGGALTALDGSGGKLDIILMQLVRLMKDGEPYRMSKRSGKSITLSDLLELVSPDVARFFFNMREAGSPMDFDLDLAVEQSSNNPVYYVQYAHARICSIMRKLEQDGVAIRTAKEEELLLLQAPEETALIRCLAHLPSAIIGVAVRYDTAALTHYAIEVANLFHKFYTACRVAGEEESLMQARIALCAATRTVIANLLGLMKITAPDSM